MRQAHAASFTVAPMDASHIEGFHACIDAVARERRFLTLTEAPSLEETSIYVREALTKGHPRFVAVAESRVVGWCDLQPLQRPVCTHRAVLGMGVAADFRGQGAGRALIEATVAAARAKGYERVELDVRADNVTAIALYRAVGFGVEGTKRRAFRIDGHYFDLLFMALDFAATSAQPLVPFEVHGTGAKPGPDPAGQNPPFFLFDARLRAYVVQPVQTYCSIKTFPTRGEAEAAASAREEALHAKDRARP